MNLSLPEDVLDQMALGTGALTLHRRLLRGWKRRADRWPRVVRRRHRRRSAACHHQWDLRPNMLMLNDALGVLSSGQRMFLSAMVSFQLPRGRRDAQALWLRGAVRLRRPRSWNGARSSLTSRCTTTAGEPRLATHRPSSHSHEGHASPRSEPASSSFAGAAMSRISIFH